MKNKRVHFKDFMLGFLTCAIFISLTSISNCGRTFSRLGFGDEVLKLPKDFKNMVSVSFHKGNNNDTIKDMTYETTDGNYKSVEYRDKVWALEGSVRWEHDK